AAAAAAKADISDESDSDSEEDAGTDLDGVVGTPGGLRQRHQTRPAKIPTVSFSNSVALPHVKQEVWLRSVIYHLRENKFPPDATGARQLPHDDILGISVKFRNRSAVKACLAHGADLFNPKRAPIVTRNNVTGADLSALPDIVDGPLHAEHQKEGTSTREKSKETPAGSRKLQGRSVRAAAANSTNAELFIQNNLLEYAILQNDSEMVSILLSAVPTEDDWLAHSELQAVLRKSLKHIADLRAQQEQQIHLSNGTLTFKTALLTNIIDEHLHLLKHWILPKLHLQDLPEKSLRVFEMEMLDYAGIHHVTFADLQTPSFLKPELFYLFGAWHTESHAAAGPRSSRTVSSPEVDAISERGSLLWEKQKTLSVSPSESPADSRRSSVDSGTGAGAVIVPATREDDSFWKHQIKGNTTLLEKLKTANATVQVGSGLAPAGHQYAATRAEHPLMQEEYHVHVSGDPGIPEDPLAGALLDTLFDDDEDDSGPAPSDEEEEADSANALPFSAGGLAFGTTTSVGEQQEERSASRFHRRNAATASGFQYHYQEETFEPIAGPPRPQDAAQRQDLLRRAHLLDKARLLHKQNKQERVNIHDLHPGLIVSRSTASAPQLVDDRGGGVYSSENDEESCASSEYGHREGEAAEGALSKAFERLVLSGEIHGTAAERQQVLLAPAPARSDTAACLGGASGSRAGPHILDALALPIPCHESFTSPPVVPPSAARRSPSSSSSGAHDSTYLSVPHTGRPMIPMIPTSATSSSPPPTDGPTLCTPLVRLAAGAVVPPASDTDSVPAGAVPQRCRWLDASLRTGILGPPRSATPVIGEDEVVMDDPLVQQPCVFSPPPGVPAPVFPSRQIERHHEEDRDLPWAVSARVQLASAAEEYHEQHAVQVEQFHAAEAAQPSEPEADQELHQHDPSTTRSALGSFISISSDSASEGSFYEGEQLLQNGRPSGSYTCAELDPEMLRILLQLKPSLILDPFLANNEAEARTALPLLPRDEDNYPQKSEEAEYHGNLLHIIFGSQQYLHFTLDDEFEARTRNASSDVDNQGGTAEDILNFTEQDEEQYQHSRLAEDKYPWLIFDEATCGFEHRVKFAKVVLEVLQQQGKATNPSADNQNFEHTYWSDQEGPRGRPGSVPSAGRRSSSNSTSSTAGRYQHTSRPLVSLAIGVQRHQHLGRSHSFASVLSSSSGTSYSDPPRRLHDEQLKSINPNILKRADRDRDGSTPFALMIRSFRMAVQEVGFVTAAQHTAWKEALDMFDGASIPEDGSYFKELLLIEDAYEDKEHASVVIAELVFDLARNRQGELARIIRFWDNYSSQSSRTTRTPNQASQALCLVYGLTQLWSGAFNDVYHQAYGSRNSNYQPGHANAFVQGFLSFLTTTTGNEQNFVPRTTRTQQAATAAQAGDEQGSSVGGAGLRGGRAPVGSCAPVEQAASGLSASGGLPTSASPTSNGTTSRTSAAAPAPADIVSNQVQVTSDLNFFLDQHHSVLSVFLHLLLDSFNAMVVTCSDTTGTPVVPTSRAGRVHQLLWPAHNYKQGPSTSSRMGSKDLASGSDGPEKKKSGAAAG
ncbi:unnamed protein product, partial [Amoebophrya sp. A120]